jgi:hypothetical protein
MLSSVPEGTDDQQHNGGDHDESRRIFEKGKKVCDRHGALLASEDHLWEKGENDACNLTRGSFYLAEIGREAPSDDLQ